MPDLFTVLWPEGTEEFVFIISVRKCWLRSCPETLGKTRLKTHSLKPLNPRDLKNQEGSVPWPCLTPHTPCPLERLSRQRSLKLGGNQF